MIKTFVSKKKEKIYIMIGCAIIFIAVLWNLANIDIIYITSDEFGYWADAAYFAGLDWSNVTKNISYYSFGYGAVLTPLIKFLSDPVIAYRAAIIVNSIFLTGSFLVLISIAKQLFDKMPKMVLIAASWAIAVYSSNIYLSQLTLSENLLWFIYNVLVLNIIHLNKKFTWKKGFLFVFLVVYMYSVHLRCLAIVCSSILFLLCLLIVKKIGWKQLLCLCGLLLVLFCCSNYIKNILIYNLYENGEVIASNDYTGQIGKLSMLFSAKGLKLFIIGLLGKIYYLGASTFLLFFWGIWFILKKLINTLKSDFMQEDMPVYIFLFCSLAAVLMVSSIYMLDSARIDTLIYGRYNEYILAPILLCGLLELYQNVRRWGLLAFFCSIQFLLTLYVSNVLADRGFVGYVYPAIAGILPLLPSYNMDSMGLWAFIVTVKIAIIAITVCGFFSFEGIKKYLNSILGAILIGGIWIGLGIHVSINTNTHKLEEPYIQIARIIDSIETEQTILYVADEESKKDWYTYTAINYIQFLLPNREIECIDYRDMDDIAENSFVITPQKFHVSNTMSEQYTQVYGERMNLFVKKDSDLEERVISLITNIQNIVERETLTTNGDNSFKSNGNEGFFVYGPYIELPRGTYEVNFELEYISGDENLGYCDISSHAGEKIFKKAEFKKSDFSEGMFTVTIPFSLADKTNRIEFRVFTNNGTVVRLKNLTYETNPWTYTPGIDCLADIEHLMEAIHKGNDISSLIWLSDDDRKVSLEYLKENLPKLEVTEMRPDEILLRKEPSYVLADRQSFAWMKLLNNHTVVEVFSNYLLLMSSSHVSDDSIALSDGTYAHSSLLCMEDNEGGFIGNKYKRLPAGSYKAIIAPKDYIKIGKEEEYTVDIYSGKIKIGTEIVMVKDNKFYVPFESETEIDNLSFYATTGSGRTVPFNMNALAMEMDSVSYHYNQMLAPLIKHKDQDGNHNSTLGFVYNDTEFDLKSSIWEITKEKCKGEIYRIKYNLNDSLDLAKAFMDIDYLIIPASSSYIFKFLQEYELLLTTERYSLMRNKNITGNHTPLSNDQTVYMDYFTALNKKKEMDGGITIPDGVFEVKVKLSSWDENDYGGKVKLYGNNRQIASVILNKQTVEHDENGYWIRFEIGDKEGMKNIRTEAIYSIGCEFKADIFSVERMSDGYTVNLFDMFRTDGMEIDVPILVNAEQDHIIYGPYIDLEAGNYEVSFQVESITPEKLNFDVSANLEEVKISDTQVERMGENKYRFALLFEIDSPQQMVEFRTHIQAGGNCLLESIFVKNLSEMEK